MSGESASVVSGACAKTEVSGSIGDDDDDGDDARARARSTAPVDAPQSRGSSGVTL